MSYLQGCDGLRVISSFAIRSSSIIICLWIPDCDESSISPAAFFERDAFPAIFAINCDLLIAFAINAQPER